jgi:hypothetical protein
MDMTRSSEKAHIGFAVDKEFDKELRVYCAKNSIKVSVFLRNLVDKELKNGSLADNANALNSVIKQLEEMRERGAVRGA